MQRMRSTLSKTDHITEKLDENKRNTYLDFISEEIFIKMTEDGKIPSHVFPIQIFQYACVPNKSRCFLPEHMQNLNVRNSKHSGTFPKGNFKK